jgi:ribonuclease Z
VLERTPNLVESECLVLEASFLDARVSPARAREMGHVHLDELLQRAELLPKTDIVLSHFSARYAKGDVARILKHRLPEDLQSRVRALI